MMRNVQSTEKWTRTFRVPLVVSSLIVLVGSFSLASAFAPTGSRRVVSITVPSSAVPEPEPLVFQAIPAAEAEKLNAEKPADPSAIAAAAPFAGGAWPQDVTSRIAALDCLASAVYYEAASESLTGQRAVAQVVLNRVRHPAYPNSVCGVVYQGAQRTTGCQFTFACDGSLNRKRSTAQWQVALGVAAAALSGYVEPAVGTATHYHTIWVVPYWQASLTKLTTIGAHVFYRWSGTAGQPAAFNQRYAGLESIGKPLSADALAAMPALPEAMAVSDASEIVAENPKPLQIGPETGTLQAVTGSSVAADEKRIGLLADENRGVLVIADKPLALQR